MPTFSDMFLKAFPQTAEKFNLLEKTQAKLDAQIAHEKRYPFLVSGLRGAFMNRYHGVQEASHLLEQAQEGLCWINYLARCPEKKLKADVRRAGVEWAKDQLTLTPSLDGLRSLAINTAAYKRGDGDKIQESVETLATERTKNLAASSGVSIFVTQMLKTVGRTGKTEFIRQTARFARGPWQVTGMMGVIYGLAQIHDAFSAPELGKFPATLKKDRDAFNKSSVPNKADFNLSRIKECKQSEPPPTKG